MRLHVDPAEFDRILHWTDFEDAIERIAEENHNHFLSGFPHAEKSPTSPGRQPWLTLDLIYRESNRDQAAHIPAKLAAVGCELVPIGSDRQLHDFPFTGSRGPDARSDGTRAMDRGAIAKAAGSSGFEAMVGTVARDEG